LKNVSSSSSEEKFSKSRHRCICAARHLEEVNYLVRDSISISCSLQHKQEKEIWH
jgi:hypothetical protein